MECFCHYYLKETEGLKLDQLSSHNETSLGVGFLLHYLRERKLCGNYLSRSKSEDRIGNSL